MKESKIPFVGLHAHSVAGSIFDALGYPNEHMDFCHSNGGEALALTDHGNMNGFSHQVLHAKKMNAEGREFKPIYGVEAYFIPSHKKWKEDYATVMEDKKAAKKAKKEETSGASVENEGESKKAARSILNKRRHLVLLAQNETGLKNLFKLISDSYTEDKFYRFPRIDYEMLKNHSEGVIAASACLGGVYAGNYWENREEGPEAVLKAMRETTEEMVGIFGDRWHGELQWNNIPEQHTLNKHIIQMHKEYGIPLISTADSHYPTPDAWESREMYKKLGWMGKSRPDWATNELPVSVEEIGYELYPKNGDQMWESYKKYSQECGVEYDDDLVYQSIIETHNIAFNRIDSFYPDTSVRLPKFVTPEGETADSALRKLAFKGLFKKGKHELPEYRERLEYELSVIADRGFSEYFLMMDKINEIAAQHMLSGPGRGSAAGSLVSYVVEITQIDPIKFDLQFERFLRSDATDYPDIDYDVSRPMELKEILADIWGDNTVVPISNWNTLQLKSLIKDISKFYDIPFAEANLVTNKMMIEATPPAKKARGQKTGVYTPTYQEVKKYSASMQAFLIKYPHIDTHVEALFGQVRSCGRHAGGVVIADDLDSHMPLISSKNVRQVPWAEGMNVRHLEPFGFIKFDILGLETMNTIEGAIRHILKRHHNIEEPTFAQINDFYKKNLHPDVLDMEDKAVWKNIFQKGCWAGIFQFTKEGSQNLCSQAKPTGIVDLAAVTSIYRPGPLEAGVDKDYIVTLNDPKSVRYVNDIHKNVTEETRGFLIFQEQISALAHTLGKDISLNEGNKIRKALTKTPRNEKLVSSYRDLFITGCVEKGMALEVSERLWATMDNFSGYGFNKSHAVSYSIVSYMCAWLLTHYEPEWVVSFLDKEPEDRKAKAIAIAKSLGYNIEPVNVNTSGLTWEISTDGTTFIQPLTSVKGVGEIAIREIMKGRPFNNIEEFLFNEEMRYSKLNKKALDVLVRCEALGCLMDNRFTGMKHFWSAVAVDRPRKVKDLHENIDLYHDEGSFTEEEKIQFLSDLTGHFPLDRVVSYQVLDRLKQLHVPPISEYDPLLQLVWAIPRKIIKKKTKTDKTYYIIEVTDSNSTSVSIKCWGVYSGETIELNKPYMFKPQYNATWGFSTRGSLKKAWKQIDS